MLQTYRDINDDPVPSNFDEFRRVVQDRIPSGIAFEAETLDGMLAVFRTGLCHPKKGRIREHRYLTLRYDNPNLPPQLVITQTPEAEDQAILYHCPPP